MREPHDPGVLSRMRAALAGERSAAALEAMRAAGAAVHEEVVYGEHTADERRVDGTSPWDVPPAAASHALATWNAWALQVLGETLLDTDHDGPGPVAFVPPAVFEQSWRWLGPVQPWLSRARQARSNPDYDIREELALPADLPPWVEAASVSATHLNALAEAETRLRDRAEFLVFTLESAKHPPYLDDDLNRLKQLAAMAGAAADYATGLRRGHVAGDTRRLVLSSLRQSLAGWYHIGQLGTFPALLRRYRLPKRPARFQPERLPGGGGFNRWCLTDEWSLPIWRTDPVSRRQLSDLWRADPNPAATLQIKAEIDRALADGDLVRVFLPGGITCYHRCPWSSLYEVRRPVLLAGRRLGVLQQFTYDVSADEMYHGRPFVRRLVLGPFKADLHRPPRPHRPPPARYRRAW